jgi:hypothetical protein
MKKYKFSQTDANNFTTEIKKQDGCPEGFVFGHDGKDGFIYLDEKTKGKYISFGLNLDTACQTLHTQNFSDYILDKTIESYRILNLVNDEFKDFPVENIDFKIHLKASIALDKTERKFSTNGRPEFVEYTYQGTKIAKRLIEFIVDDDTNFVQRRIEKLAYYRDDGAIGEYFTIKDKSYTLAKDGDLIMKERELSRKKIINDVKGLVITVLGIHNPENTYDENLHQASAFFKHHAGNISTFIETGVASKAEASEGDYLLDAINSDTECPLLNYPTYGILGEGTEAVTLRIAINGIVNY